MFESVDGRTHGRRLESHPMGTRRFALDKLKDAFQIRK